MELASSVLIGVIAALHLWFLVLEMFLWEKPQGRATFGLSAEDAATTASLAKNQGLYNGFLVAGLVWSLIANEPLDFRLRVFFLSCVAVAGVFGALTASRRILYVQALPAVVALLLVLVSR